MFFLISGQRLVIEREWGTLDVTTPLFNIENSAWQRMHETRMKKNLKPLRWDVKGDFNLWRQSLISQMEQQFNTVKMSVCAKLISME